MFEEEKKQFLLGVKSGKYIPLNDEVSGYTMCLIVYGSRVYGFSLDDSDVDSLAICSNTPENILLGNDFVLKTDWKNSVHIHSLQSCYRKIVCSGDINYLEMLYFSPDQYIINTDVFQELRNNRSLFSAREMYFAYLKTIKDYFTPILSNSVQKIRKQVSRYAEESARRYIQLYGDSYFNSSNNSFSGDVSGLLELLSGVHSQMSLYDSLGIKQSDGTIDRTLKRTANWIRLLSDCADLLWSGYITPNHLDDKLHYLMLDIRNGKLCNDDGVFTNEFCDVLDYYESKVFDAFDRSPLQNYVDKNNLDKLMVKLNREIVDGSWKYLQNLLWEN